MLDTIFRIGHRLGQGHQNRHVFWPTARHDAVNSDVPRRGAAVVWQDCAKHLMRVAFSEFEEVLNFGLCWWDDRQTIAPTILVVKPVDLLESALEDNV